MKALWLIAPLLAFAPALPLNAQIAAATVTGGKVTGTVADGLSIFKGIPFAAAPVGPLRWKAPQAAASWSGIRQASAFGPGCMQDPGMARVMGDTGPLNEDCLYLNVWTPAKSAGQKLPVIVWIYGGGFTGGMTSIPLYDGANLAKRGVVFVSIAYRVGAFGFLAHPELSAESGHGSGNYGMLDMIDGLKWVQANVAQFGGDPHRVTLLGHSAGAFAVSMLAASPLAKGLFAGVIAESGASFAPPRAADEGGSNLPSLTLAEANGTKFLAELGAKDLAAARAVPAATIMNAAQKQGPDGVRFWPPTDGYVVPDDQYALWQSGRFIDVPILVGSNSDEAAAFMGERKPTPASFEAEVRKGYGAKADAILGAYPHADDEEAFRATKQLMRDTSFGWQAYTWARLQSSNGKAKAFVYYFDRPTPATPDGTPHGIEVGYVFGNFRPRPGFTPGPDDFALSDRMQRYWINFATNGDPNGPDLPRWPAFRADAPAVMRLGDEPVAVSVPNWSKLDALDEYYAWRRSASK